MDVRVVPRESLRSILMKGRADASVAAQELSTRVQSAMNASITTAPLQPPAQLSPPMSSELAPVASPRPHASVVPPPPVPRFAPRTPTVTDALSTRAKVAFYLVGMAMEALSWLLTRGSASFHSHAPYGAALLLAVVAILSRARWTSSPRLAREALLHAFMVFNAGVVTRVIVLIAQLSSSA